MSTENLISVEVPVSRWRIGEDSIEGFIANVREAAKGLKNPYVDAYEFYETTQIAVFGERERTPEERAEYERQERLIYLQAKATVERLREKYEDVDR
jgi:hypothetical protein